MLTLTALAIPYCDPQQAFLPFRDAPHAVLLDSAANDGGRGRFSYIAADPFDLVVAKAEISPFDLLAEKLTPFKISPRPDLPPFQGGAVGFIGYEAGRHLENLPSPQSHGDTFPEFYFGLFDTLVAFDHVTERAWVLAVEGITGRSPADQRAANFAAKIAAAKTLADIDWRSTAKWRAEVSRDQFEDMVQQTVDYIYAGDIFQANITQRFLAQKPKGLAPFDLYRRLRTLSPAPYAAFLTLGPDQFIASASPECFLKLDRDGRIETRPIKGTRPRGANRDDDERLAADLLASSKDKAENLMIVDLLRNDLSRVADIGSVRVPTLCGLETFSSVHHLVSVVVARLKKGLGPVDLLKATFPGGSITGAPKIRAMEIINELEPARRGPYCGTIAWIGFDGTLESSIVIRTIIGDGDTIIAQAGGGIVADSDPAAEYEESLTKAGPLLKSLQGLGT